MCFEYYPAFIHLIGWAGMVPGKLRRSERVGITVRESKRVCSSLFYVCPDAGEDDFCFLADGFDDFNLECAVRVHVKARAAVIAVVD